MNNDTHDSGNKSAKMVDSRAVWMFSGAHSVSVPFHQSAFEGPIMSHWWARPYIPSLWIEKGKVKEKLRGSLIIRSHFENLKRKYILFSFQYFRFTWFFEISTDLRSLFIIEAQRRENSRIMNFPGFELPLSKIYQKAVSQEPAI